MKETMQCGNPLLDLSGLPDFGAILPEHVEPAVDRVLSRNRREIRRLIDTVENPGWDSFMAPLEQLADELERIWAPVSHLNAVRDSEDLRTVYQKCLVKLSDYWVELGQNKALYRTIQRIRHHDRFDGLEQARRKAIDNDLRDFRLSGIDLEPAQRERFREISGELSRLGNLFSRNLLDATDAWHVDVTGEAGLDGIPDHARQAARQAAGEAGVDGWRFTLQEPSYKAVMNHAEDGGLREEMYRAFATRASETGPGGGKWDNSGVMRDILELRREQAQLLGYGHYAEYSLATRMAQSTDEIFGFIRQLSDKCRPAGLKEVERLKSFARENLGLDDLAPWDYAWAGERLRQHQYGFSGETVRPYFPLPTVLDGMFRIAGRLFGIDVEPADAPSVWLPDVRFFRVRDRDGETRAYFYADLYARRHKRGGAWMADCVGRRGTDAGVQLPVAFLTCNFTAPVDGRPCLLTHEEVITLFHEFGHGLHHMLTRVDVAAVAGINGVPWDAVELPSQFLENWCWEQEALDLVSGHVDTGEPLPVELLEKMRRSRNFHSAMGMCRQLEFALFDMRLHSGFDPGGGETVLDLLEAVRDEVAVVRAPAFNRFPHSFGHIFAGGYAAGYYSYLWAEVLSADAFSLFEETGIFDRDTGQRFLHWILERGGSEEPMVLFEGFRGRKPTVDALLRHSGLSPLGEAA
ncbi:MAG: M3 family metallopeptidase [Gammaproteobacteria bacterium]|nr:M3 family metallopeptidase [Gammaproteobacteria bacterium]